MIIISDYTTVDNKDGIKRVLNNGKLPVCPLCQADSLKHRDYRTRHMKKPAPITPEKVYFGLERFKCEECGHLHLALPDFLVKFKHYGSKLIQSVIDGKTTSDDLETEDHPTQQTMILWCQWFKLNYTYIENYLRSLISRLSSSEQVTLGKSVLNKLKDREARWLPTIVKTIYNSGGALTPLPN